MYEDERQFTTKEDTWQAIVTNVERITTEEIKI